MIEMDSLSSISRTLTIGMQATQASFKKPSKAAPLGVKEPRSRVSLPPPQQEPWSLPEQKQDS